MSLTMAEFGQINNFLEGRRQRLKELGISRVDYSLPENIRLIEIVAKVSDMSSAELVETCKCSEATAKWIIKSARLELSILDYLQAESEFQKSRAG